MGVVAKKLRVFAATDVADRSLMMLMLKFEDNLFFARHKQEGVDASWEHFTTRKFQLSNQRKTMIHFGFEPSDESIETYHTIVDRYQNDLDVLSKVYYLRENRLLYYRSQALSVGDTAPLFSIFDVSGAPCHFDATRKRPVYNNETTMDAIDIPTLLCAFSSSWPPFLHRKDEFLSVASRARLNIVMVYINEAHTTLWPSGHIAVEPQQSLADRFERARQFRAEHDTSAITLLVDDWTNTFENLYRAWPDQYFLIEKGVITAKSEYFFKGDNDGKIIVDCLDIVKQFASWETANNVFSAIIFFCEEIILQTVFQL